MRKVRIWKYERELTQGKTPIYVPKPTEEIGVFHRWGIDNNEGDPPGHFSTAIVEMPDGTIRNLHTELVQFVDFERPKVDNYLVSEHLKSFWRR